MSDPILVYNQTFIQDNFYVSDSLKGIFSLSKENKTAEETISKATSKLAKLEQILESKRTEYQDALQIFETQKQQAIDEVWKIISPDDDDMITRSKFEEVSDDALMKIAEILNVVNFPKDEL